MFVNSHFGWLATWEDVVSDSIATCSIVIRGPLDESWVNYVGDPVMSSQIHDGEINVTMLAGSLPDFAAFIGLVTRVHNRGLLVLAAHYHCRPTGH